VYVCQCGMEGTRGTKRKCELGSTLCAGFLLRPTPRRHRTRGTVPFEKKNSGPAFQIAGHRQPLGSVKRVRCTLRCPRPPVLHPASYGFLCAPWSFLRICACRLYNKCYAQDRPACVTVTKHQQSRFQLRRWAVRWNGFTHCGIIVIRAPAGTPSGLDATEPLFSLRKERIRV
jgi:hypothetical protein